MKVEMDSDFKELRNQFSVWRKRFPMFVHDVNQIENIIENHIQTYSIHLVYYRQTKQKQYLSKAQKEIDKINELINTLEKIELMAMLSRG